MAILNLTLGRETSRDEVNEYMRNQALHSPLRKQIDFSNSFYRGQFKWQWRPNLPIENDFFVSYGINKVAFDAAENLFV